MVDCYGIISVHWNDNGKYDLFNNVDRGWTVAEIKSATDLYFDSGRLYVIDDRPPRVCNNTEVGMYCADFEVKGSPQQFSYASLEKIPKYIVLDTKTGNERFHANLNEVPEAERAIFQHLLNR